MNIFIHCIYNNMQRNQGKSCHKEDNVYYPEVIDYRWIARQDLRSPDGKLRRDLDFDEVFHNSKIRHLCRDRRHTSCKRCLGRSLVKFRLLCQGYIYICAIVRFQERDQNNTHVRFLSLPVNTITLCLTYNCCRMINIGSIC